MFELVEETKIGQPNVQALKSHSMIDTCVWIFTNLYFHAWHFNHDNVMKVEPKGLFKNKMKERVRYECMLWTHKETNIFLKKLAIFEEKDLAKLASKWNNTHCIH